MKRSFWGSISAILILMLAVLAVGTELAAQGNGKLKRSDSRIADRYIVVLEDDAVGGRGFNSRAEAVASEMSAVHGLRVGNVYRFAVSGFSAEMNEGQAIALSRDPRVRSIEEDGVVSIGQTQTNATWGLDRIDQRNLPLSSTYTYDQDGSGVRAYILDTGILANHTDFGNRVVSGFTAINDGRGTSDCNGHGTHVAGTTGGNTWGVAKNVTLVAVRVLDCRGSGTTSGVIAGVDWVAQQKTSNPGQPSVANMSLGGGTSSTLDIAVNNAINKGVAFVVAAGNSNANACNYSPARVAAAITVGATTSSDARASYSNFGTCLDIFAPGSSIRSAWYTSTTATNTISGTSMASPHVAGVAALYLQAFPSASPATVRNAIVNGGTTGQVTSAGSGSPNVLLYSLITGGGGSPTNQPPTAGFTFSCSGLACSFTDTSTDSDGTVSSRSWNFGDGGTSTATDPSKTYSAAGTYTVTLTVTDDDGATGSTSKSVTVSSSTTGIALTVQGYKQSGIKIADLAWSGTGATSVDIFRNNVKVATTANDGQHTDNTGQRGGGSNTYRVCNAGTTTCSNNVTVTY